MIIVPKERDFTPDELLSGKWLKLGQNCRMFVVWFNNDGQFLERDLFNENDPGVLGQWRIENGLLSLTTQWAGSQYVLVVGASNGPIHGGLENDQTPFKLIHLR